VLQMVLVRLFGSIMLNVLLLSESGTLFQVRACAETRIHITSQDQRSRRSCLALAVYAIHLVV
jgi:hypothetical protein